MGLCFLFSTVNALSTLKREDPRLDLKSQHGEKGLEHRISANMTQGSSDV